MKVGILGSGDVAKALAGGFLKHGHQVVLGTRDAAKLKDWVAQHQEAQTGSFADAAKFGELVVLAVKGTVALDALNAAGAVNLAGKPVIDATNPIADAPPVIDPTPMQTSAASARPNFRFASMSFLLAFCMSCSPRICRARL